MDPILLAMHNRQAEEAARRKRLAAQAAAAAGPRYGPEGPGPGPTAAAASPGAPAPAPPNFAELLAQLAAQAPNRSEDEWKTLLDARVAPFTDAINASSNQARAFNEYNFETKAAANKGLGEGFLSILTGGKTGDDAMAYSKANFGGSYLPAQAMSLAANKLSELTADFDEGDWKITGQYLEAMQEIPGIREELREKLEKSDMDAYTRKVTEATLLMDETWRYWQENRKNFESDRAFEQSEREIKREKGETAKDFAERKRQFDKQFALAEAEQRVRLGLDEISTAASALNAESGAVRAATGARNAEIRNAELGLKQANQQYAKAKDKVAQQQAQERINIAKGNLEVARMRAENAAKPRSNKTQAAFTPAKKQEMSQIALETAADDFDAGTKPVETLRDLIAAGVPFSIAIRAIQRYGKASGADPYWVATLGWKK